MQADEPQMTADSIEGLGQTGGAPMDVTEYAFFNVQLRQPNGRFVTLNGRKFGVNRSLGSSGRTLSFIYSLIEALRGEDFDVTVFTLPCKAIVFRDEVQALPGRQAKLLAIWGRRAEEATPRASQ
jgi:hypothetical protein